jgi:hypothetical protein
MIMTLINERDYINIVPWVMALILAMRELNREVVKDNERDQSNKLNKWANENGWMYNNGLSRWYKQKDENFNYRFATKEQLIAIMNADDTKTHE